MLTWKEPLGVRSEAQVVHELVRMLYASHEASGRAVSGFVPPKDSTLPSAKRTACT